jgi:lysophospholipid acyltransferase (LPLAT)-like uncharacterized protein
VKIRNPRWIRIAAFVLSWIVRIWIGTVRSRQVSANGRRHPLDPRTERCIYVAWHDSILSLLSIKTPIDVLISQHADGELIAQACGFLNIGAIRGSATRGGTVAGLEIVRSRSKRHLLITPDGPRGPRHRLQLGAIALASMTGLPLMLVAIGHRHAWQLRTWDRLNLPYPGSLILGVLSEPIRIPPRLTRAEIELYRGRIERRFLHLTELAMRWAETGRRPRLPQSAEMDDVSTALPKSA